MFENLYTYQFVECLKKTERQFDFECAQSNWGLIN